MFKYLLVGALAFGGVAALMVWSKPASKPFGQEWTTYTSPDGRVRFEHPTGMRTVPHPKFTEVQQSGFYMRSQSGDRYNFIPDATASGFMLFGPEDSMMMTFIMCHSDKPIPNFCKRAVEELKGGIIKPITPLGTLELGNGTGYGQKFQGTENSTIVEMTGICVQLGPTYVHMLTGFPVDRRQESEEICRRIIKSLIIHPQPQ